MTDTLFNVCGGALALFIGFILFRAFRRPSWRMQPHYGALRARLEEPRAESSADAWLAPVISFDHANQLGRTRYIVRIDLPGRPFLPEHVALHAFTFPNKATYQSEQDEPHVLFYRLGCDHRSHFFELKAFEFLPELAQGLTHQQLHDYLDAHPHLHQREHTYDPGTETLSMTFYLDDSLFTVQRDMPDAQRLDEVVAVIAPLLDLFGRCVPLMAGEAQRWIALYHIACRDQDARYCLAQVLAHHQGAPEFNAFWTHLIQEAETPTLQLLFDHDRARFNRDIDAEALQKFVLEQLSGVSTMTPELLASAFGDTLSFHILLDTKTPLPIAHRAELIRHWLTHRSDDPNVDVIHRAIAMLSSKEQAQLRALLHSDSSMSGALTHSQDDAGQLSLSANEES